MKKLLSIFLLVFALFISAGAQNNSSFSAYKFVRFIQYLSGNYVDTINVNQLVDDAIIEILGQLDPHSIYISKEDVQAMNEPLEGNFEGIGVEFNILNDTLIVVNPISGGPSERVGIMAGDRIVEIDGKPITNIGLKIPDVHKLLRGPKGTRVDVKILRKGVSQLLDFTIIRDKIPIYSIDASYMARPGIGYIKINRFAATTEQEFVEALEKLEKEKMADLIIDLRNNGGGFLNSAYELASYLLEPGKIVVYTQGRNSPRTDYFSHFRGRKPFKGRLVIITDEGSASASEILAGAIQDWDRGIVVGRRTFGKGLVQNQLPLPDGSMIRLTVAKYFTPTGRAIQKPYKMGDMKDYYSDLDKRYSRGEFFNQDSVHFPDSLKYTTLVKKKVVYGGGGIMPDVFVPLDTTYYSEYYGKLVRTGLINQFAITWVDANRELLKKKYPKFEVYNKNFEVTDNILDELYSYAESRQIARDSTGIQTSKAELKLQLKGLFAQSLFGSGFYYQVTNEHNESFIKSLEVINNWTRYKHLVQ